MTEPKRIGKYEILDEIGSGGFAVVYKARDTELNREVALKVLHPQHTIDPKFIQRFHQEAQTAARLHHPHIVTIYEVGEEAGQHYIAMALLPGRTLDTIVDGKPLPMDQAISIIEQLADALDAIHMQGLVHRDVKPANVIVNEGRQATLLDFGIVRAAEGTRLTTTMTTLGTPEYMAPEQAEIAEGAVDIDWRADIYALGVVAYEMLVGQPPFTGRTPTAILHKHVYEQPPAPRALNSDLPEAMEPVLLKALAKGREERFQRAGALAAELRRAYLTESQTRERESQLALLYEQVQAAAEEEDWTEVLALGGQIRALDSAYRDVAECMERARRELRRTRRRVLPTLVWGMVGLAVLGVLGLMVLFLSRWDEWVALVTSTKTPTEPLVTPVATQVRPAYGMVMVYVPAGEFEMGSMEGDDDEQPVHTVALDAFWIDQTEVSKSQFAAFVDDTGYETDAEREGWSWVRTGGEWEQMDGADWQRPEGPDSSAQDGHPVVHISWDDAVAYCEWAGARLPTEAEWEYAARGPDGYLYPWGDDFDCSRGNFDDETRIDDYVVPGGEGCDGYERTAPVGSFPAGASWCGALDLAGNVWEWVADWYASDYYERSPSENPPGPEEGEYRVLRGGSWIDNPTTLYSASRDWFLPGYRSDYIGFRCAMDSR